MAPSTDTTTSIAKRLSWILRKVSLRYRPKSRFIHPLHQCTNGGPILILQRSLHPISNLISSMHPGMSDMRGRCNSAQFFFMSHNMCFSSSLLRQVS